MSDSETDITKYLVTGDGKHDAKVNSSRSKSKRQGTTALNHSHSNDSESEDDDLLPHDLLPSNVDQGNNKGASKGTFLGLGLSNPIAAAVKRKGYKQPTPIQRRTIPVILEGKDVVGMARTGSGKTAAFMLPIIDMLKSHSAQVGARALILTPSRELALQTIRVFKDFSSGTDLRCALLVGGDSLEDQFGFMMSNPDIIIATPGRFLHLKVEMNLNLKTIQYVVFDEADRLFEMGFSLQLTNILSYLPEFRQSLLFSATLPKSLVEFAKAGLHDPVLVRLDAEQKIPENLEMAFFGIRSSERDAALVYLLSHVIKMPFASEAATKKSGKVRAGEVPSPHSTIVFVPTKHHVEHVATYLRELGYAVSFIYGSLDQHARKEQLQKFRAGLTTVMVVTDVAARGIDIPVLANVINYTFPSSPKIFIHRVGRTARAGNHGWAYSIIKEADLPYLLDLELFLGLKLSLSCNITASSDVSFRNSLMVGGFPRDELETIYEEIESLHKENYDLLLMRNTSLKGEKLFLKTRNPASTESVRRAKQITGSDWMQRHVLLKAKKTASSETDSKEADRLAFLAKIENYKPTETVFELNKKSNAYSEMSDLMARRRKEVAHIQERVKDRRELLNKEKSLKEDVIEESSNTLVVDMTPASVDDIEHTFKSQISGSKKLKSFKDPNFYISHTDKDDATEKGYTVNSFADQAKNVTFDLMRDDDEGKSKNGMKWDRKKGRYVQSNGGLDENGKGAKWIKGENGLRIQASFKSGKYEAWKAAHKVSDINESGEEYAPGKKGHIGFKFRHTKIQAPKKADKARDDYKTQLKKSELAKERMGSAQNRKTLRSSREIAKKRQEKEKRRDKNARPSKKRKR
ncbi:hypothetical protein CANCADRAFT_42961 [Tortispora caseinolytica NRRL Y-17796]|uniref:ATP-dependent RNA helicase DBP10 n=1 Tax=Tortispora caseinolytica NRRL Y-17796 TaxID=767744 RepID=A0A1E4TKT9_9ASCO|nr:hypothetical protein CANCADRAFT_42961 [Tortispora caseinolytica NRRL Y-17796]